MNILIYVYKIVINYLLSSFLCYFSYLLDHFFTFLLFFILMYILNIARAKRCLSIKSETLSLKTIINKLDFAKENSYYLMKRLKKKKIYCCLQRN